MRQLLIEVQRGQGNAVMHLGEKYEGFCMPKQARPAHAEPSTCGRCVYHGYRSA